MNSPVLIFCSGGNRRYVDLAVSAGFRYGARIPSTIYPEFGPLYFADQDWRSPDRTSYMAGLAMHQPTIATVIDWEREEQLSEVLSWADEAAAHVDAVQIIPKVIGGIARLPRVIGGKPVVLGYSVATTFGGTAVPIWEFAGWPVHLLGGSPQRQMTIWRYLAGIADVVSCDGNVIRKMANNCQTWVPGTARRSRNRWFPLLADVGLGEWGQDAPYEAFRRSCGEVLAAWARLVGVRDG